MLKYTNVLLFLIVCTGFMPQQFGDRLIAGQLAKNKSAYQYIYDVPIYRKLFSEYQRDCSWGYYISVEKHSKTPSFGLVFMF
jgi:hypothetical protein